MLDHLNKGTQPAMAAHHPEARHGQASAGPGHALVIDVRTEPEYAAAALDGAINVPLAQLAQRIAGLVADPSTPLALYCATGGRSGMACTLLKQLGYARVTNAGGLLAAAALLQREVRH